MMEWHKGSLFGSMKRKRRLQGASVSKERQLPARGQVLLTGAKT